MLNKEHITLEGLKKIVSLKSNINLGLSTVLIESFPDIVPKNLERSRRWGCSDHNLDVQKFIQPLQNYNIHQHSR